MRTAGVWVAGLITVAACGAGCVSADHDHSPPTTAPAVATDVDPARADPEFWLNQSPALNVTSTDYEKLWQSAERVSHDYLFTIDRRDRRLGLLSTVPNVSPQFFEPWRRELQTASDVAYSSTASYRRTIYWQFGRDGDAYAVTPKVLIERESFQEQRISGLLSRAYFHPTPQQEERIYGTRETDQNLILPATYWYPVGRDFAFEQKLVEKMDRQLVTPTQ